MGIFCVMVRGSGLAWDLRRSQPYECYSDFDFKIPVGKNGDCYDRYLCRVWEMKESVKIIQQSIEKLSKCMGEDVLIRGKIAPPKRSDMKKSMESLIHHFKLYTEGFHVPKGEVYVSVEAPREFGVFWFGWNKKAQSKITAYTRLTVAICASHQLADVSHFISLDVVFGEIDR